MFSENVITDIIYWIEDNLEQDLSLESVSQKSGYSKWHLQRMFKEQTDLTLASYIRARRLSCAAIELRLQRTPLLDIALKYRFDSQQTFSRAFKKLFNITPYDYRRKINWQAYGFTLPLRKFSGYNLDMQIVNIDNLSLVGLSHTYKSNPTEWDLNTEKPRKEYWTQFFKHALYKHKKIYATHNIISKQKNALIINYATMIENSSQLDTCNLNYTEEINDVKHLKIHIPKEFLHLNYKDIIYNIYGVLMRTLNIPRKNGLPDIEEYILIDNYHVLDLINKPLSLLKEVNYYIPIEIQKEK